MSRPQGPKTWENGLSHPKKPTFDNSSSVGVGLREPLPQSYWDFGWLDLVQIFCKQFQGLRAMCARVLPRPTSTISLQAVFCSYNLSNPFFHDNPWNSDMLPLLKCLVFCSPTSRGKSEYQCLEHCRSLIKYLVSMSAPSCSGTKATNLKLVSLS